MPKRRVGRTAVRRVDKIDKERQKSFDSTCKGVGILNSTMRERGACITVVSELGLLIMMNIIAKWQRIIYFLQWIQFEHC